MTFLLRLSSYVFWAFVILVAVFVVVEVGLWTIYLLRRYLVSRFSMVANDIIGGVKSFIKRVSPPQTKKGEENENK